jgi:hypothetical protein
MSGLDDDRSSRRWRVCAGAVIGVLCMAFPMSAVSAQPSIQTEVVEGVMDRGWWDDTNTLPESEMRAVVARWGDQFGFAYTDRSFDVQQDPALSAAALLAQSSLEQLQLAGGPQTLLFIVGDDAAGASTEFPYPNVVIAMSDVDRRDVVGSFDDAARKITELGSGVSSESVAQAGFFGSTAMFILLGGVTGVLALASVRSSRKKKSRRVHTAHARSSTSFEIQEMSDLILDLEPRVTIADDAAMKARYVDASKTYSEVLEYADQVETGHDVADLRIEIARARWKLDVIDAELDGRQAPPEPFRRDNTGSAWESTRGSGSAGPSREK